jgi:hypothetical protein
MSACYILIMFLVFYMISNKLTSTVLYSYQGDDLTCMNFLYEVFIEEQASAMVYFKSDAKCNIKSYIRCFLIF